MRPEERQGKPLLFEHGSGALGDDGWGSDGSTHSLNLWCHPCGHAHTVEVIGVERLVYALLLEVQRAAGWRDDSAASDGMPDECFRTLIGEGFEDDVVRRMVAGRRTGTLPPPAPPKRKVSLYKSQHVYISDADRARASAIARDKAAAASRDLWTAEQVIPTGPALDAERRGNWDLCPWCPKQCTSCPGTRSDCECYEHQPDPNAPEAPQC